jgi:hypothetical protein
MIRTLYDFHVLRQVLHILRSVDLVSESGLPNLRAGIYHLVWCTPDDRAIFEVQPVSSFVTVGMLDVIDVPKKRSFRPEGTGIGVQWAKATLLWYIYHI